MKLTHPINIQCNSSIFKVDTHAAVWRHQQRNEKVSLWLLYTANTGRRRGQHPERTYASKSKERTERRISGESCLSEASYAAARSGVSSFN